MRILICSECPPLPPFSGLRLVLSSLLHELRPQHEVRFVCLATAEEASRCDPATTRPVISERRPWTRPADVAYATLTGRPVDLDKLARAIARPVAEELGNFKPDVVYVTGNLAHLGRELRGIPSVLVPLDALHRNWEARSLAAQGLRRRLLAKETDRVRRFEQAEYPAFGRVVVVSEKDRDALIDLCDRLRVVVIPNGVDADHFAPDDAQQDRDTVAFHGTMDWPPNVLAVRSLAERIWPRVLEQEPRARLVLIGRNPTAELRALERQPSIRVTGDVPDVRPWLHEAAVYACPMTSGTGIKNKLLEAMALGLACVATTRALGGLKVQPGQHLLVADDEDEFAAAIVRLMRDEELRTTMGQAGREYVRAAHSWEQVAQEFVKVSEAVIAEA